MRKIFVIFGFTLIASCAAVEESDHNNDGYSGSGYSQPTTWEDPVYGCVYVLRGSSGIELRRRSDGRPDCPDTRDEAF